VIYHYHSMAAYVMTQWPAKAANDGCLFSAMSGTPGKPGTLERIQGMLSDEAQPEERVCAFTASPDAHLAWRRGSDLCKCP